MNYVIFGQGRTGSTLLVRLLQSHPQLAALRLEPHVVSTTKQRTWNRPYPELITNYAELQSLTETDQGRALQTEWELLINRG